VLTMEHIAPRHHTVWQQRQLQWQQRPRLQQAQLRGSVVRLPVAAAVANQCRSVQLIRL
jgi:hypothetical protein